MLNSKFEIPASTLQAFCDFTFTESLSSTCAESSWPLTPSHLETAAPPSRQARTRLDNHYPDSLTPDTKPPPHSLTAPLTHR